MSEFSSNKPTLDEVVFKSTYIATFLASYMASRYERDCQQGHPVDKQPVEDADHLANVAWETIQDYL